MNVMRYTVVDVQGAVSFVAPCEALLPLVAACAENPRNLNQLLSYAGRYYRPLKERVSSGLAVFDEHNGVGDYRAIHSALRYGRAYEIPAFRVVDDQTRQASLEPVKAGVVLFNLIDRRIVQVHNTYREVRRRGKVQVYRSEAPTDEVHLYELPPTWHIVP